MGPEWIVVGVIAVAVLFGAKKIPEMARSVGRAQGEFKRGIREGVIDEAAETQAPAPAPQAPAPQAQTPAPQAPPTQASPPEQTQPPQPPQNGSQT